MIVYYHGSPDKPPQAEYTMIVCPANDIRQPFIKDAKGNATEKRSAPPDDWVNEVDGELRPKQIPVVFRHGQAEVEDSIGRYLLARGLVQPSRLVRANDWTG